MSAPTPSAPASPALSMETLEAAVGRAVRVALLDAPPPPAALRLPDAAKYVGLGLRTLHTLIASGEIKPARVGRRVVVLRSTLDAFLAGHVVR